MMQISLRCHKEIVAGMATSIESVLAFAAWADQMGARLSADAIRQRFECSRATSYRWLSAYRAARGRQP